MSDSGAAFTDKELAKLEKEITSIYKQASKDIKQKLNEFNSKYAIKEQIHLQELADGKITQEQFDAWKKGQVFQGKQWEAKRDQIQDTIANANSIATNILNGHMTNAFTTNANFMSYQMEHDTGINFGFGIYDSATVANLLKNDPQLLPKWKINEPKDYIWNKKNVRTAVTQGIIQGEKLDQIADRLAKGLSTKNKNKMLTFARTAMTGAQNAGRIYSLNEAKNLGIDVEKQWMCTLDSYTRINHRLLDGQTRPNDEPFEISKYKIMYPGDPDAAPEMVYNCRCTLVGNVKKYPATYNRYDNIDGKPIKNMSYSDWEEAKKKGEDISPVSLKHTTAKPSHTVVNGSDISETWKRRSDQFDFEIEDVINAQGFDGLPRVVSKEEFDKAVKAANDGNGFIAQRAYSAETQEIVDAYRDQLYYGKWYVDCSVGGARHGQGMYCISNYDGIITDGMMSEANAYATYYGKRPSHIETFTVDPSAKFIEEDTIRKMMKDYNNNIRATSYSEAILETLQPESVGSMIEKYKKYFGVNMTEGDMSTYIKGMQLKNMNSNEFTPSLKKQTNQIIKKYGLKDHSLVSSMYRSTNSYKNVSDKTYNDIGSFAASKGWDGIKVSGREEEPYLVILNRTKVIFCGDSYD